MTESNTHPPMTVEERIAAMEPEERRVYVDRQGRALRTRCENQLRFAKAAAAQVDATATDVRIAEELERIVDVLRRTY